MPRTMYTWKQATNHVICIWLFVPIGYLTMYCHPYSHTEECAGWEGYEANGWLRHEHVSIEDGAKEAPSTAHTQVGPGIRWGSLTCTTGMTWITSSTTPGGGGLEPNLSPFHGLPCPAIKKQRERASMRAEAPNQKARQKSERGPGEREDCVGF
jgi:hypothetical protein